ncbi:MAG: TetR/AcrR family transcriptional regulator [Treponema sp.]|jgi:AcrR family transcriptional regulator|nr:TetR/AcrR family transcriptional regulator [Treponema sp.]
MEKSDIRIRFTKKTLRDALLDLMKVSPIQNIPIKAICGEAGVSRSTFYIYYEDQYDLLREIEDEPLVEIEKIIKKYKDMKTFSSAGRERIEILRNVLDYVAGNSNSIQVLLSENGDTGF